MHPSVSSSRRQLLSSGATLGALFCLQSTVATAADKSADATSGRNGALDLPVISHKRTLGRGRFSMDVSALGFGVMGLNYNRGPHPDRKALITMLHQAAERGVTLFDTAQVYGPLINEALAGEG